MSTQPSPAALRAAERIDCLVRFYEPAKLDSNERTITRLARIIDSEFAEAGKDRERLLELCNHFHAVTCGVNDLLQMCREHFIEAPAMGEWARHCLSAQLKIKYVLEERAKLLPTPSAREEGV